MKGEGLRMKGEGLRMMVGGRSFDRLRMKGEGLRMKGEGLRIMLGGKNEIDQDAIAMPGLWRFNLSHQMPENPTFHHVTWYIRWWLPSGIGQ